MPGSLLVSTQSKSERRLFRTLRKNQASLEMIAKGTIVAGIAIFSSLEFPDATTRISLPVDAVDEGGLEPNDVMDFPGSRDLLTKDRNPDGVESLDEVPCADSSS